MIEFFKKNHETTVNLVVYIIMMIVGILTLIYPGWGFRLPALYSSVIFFIFAFFSFIGYFYMKNKYGEENITYEMLFFSLICIISGTYLFAFKAATLTYALGTGFLAFTVFSLINRIYFIRKMRRDANELWLLRTMCVILIAFFATLTIQNFYREVSEVQDIMVGYFFLSYGLVSLVESILLVTVSPRSFKKFVDGDISKDSKMKRIDKVSSHREEFDRIVKEANIEKPKKKNNKRSRK